MEIYSFLRDEGHQITKFNSNFILTRIAKTENPAHIGFVSLEPGGAIGFHQAVVSQLLVVIEGEGWIRTGNQEKQKISRGEAVLWEKGEWHETISEIGMSALIIESEKLTPADLLKLL